MTKLPRTSELHRLLEPDAFFWAAGIEDTFITAPWPATGRTLDEYELTGHYERVNGDLDLAASLGVSVMRYGIPWHRIQPTPDTWDWSFADTALNGLLDRGIDPIVDLVHYGLPPWLDGAYLSPDYPARVAEYAGRMAERYAGKIFAYTPLNEPRITAWYCGRLGWWPPFAHGWRGFVRVMLGVCRGIIETVRALETVDPEIVPYHVDATDLYLADAKDGGDVQAVAAFRQEIVFLALDLVSGKITGPSHPLYDWLLSHGASVADLEWFAENAVALPVIGLNLYPMFTQKRVKRDKAGRLRITMPYGDETLVTRLGRLYAARYPGSALFIGETASVGSVLKRREWMESSVAAVRHLRGEGVPLVGYTWWPMFSLVAWAYRQGTRPPDAYLEPMGLWDLAPGSQERRETPLVEIYREWVAAGVPHGDDGR